MSDMTMHELVEGLIHRTDGFNLDFNGEANLGHPENTAWTLTFKPKGGDEQNFGWDYGYPLEGLFQWALDFIDGKLAANGQVIS